MSLAILAFVFMYHSLETVTLSEQGLNSVHFIGQKNKQAMTIVNMYG